MMIYLMLILTSCTRLPIDDGWSHGSLTQIKDLFTSSFVIEYEDGVVLMDSGFDDKGKPILSFLEQINKSPEDVVAVFYTHGHGDHIGGTDVFSNAQTYALSEERELIEEEGGRLDVELQSGEISMFGENSIEIISVIGHTTGNAVYLVNDILIMGDSAQARRDNALEPVSEKYSDNPIQAARSLEDLGRVLEPRKDDITWTVFSHSGPLKGIDALLKYQSE